MKIRPKNIDIIIEYKVRVLLIDKNPIINKIENPAEFSK
jgi:hypothetical protein